MSGFEILLSCFPGSCVFLVTHVLLLTLQHYCNCAITQARDTFTCVITQAYDIIVIVQSHRLTTLLWFYNHTTLLFMGLVLLPPPSLIWTDSSHAQKSKAQCPLLYKNSQRFPNTENIVHILWFSFICLYHFDLLSLEKLSQCFTILKSDLIKLDNLSFPITLYNK